MPLIDPALVRWLEALAYLAAVLGIPAALVTFVVERRKDRALAAQEIYLRPNQQYLEYLKLCFAHPELDIYDLATPADRSPVNTKREWIAFNMLVSIMEQAYLLYRHHPDQDNKQWRGWQDYMRWWLLRPNFRRAWDGALANQFDTDFIAFMNGLPVYEPAPGELDHDWMYAGPEGHLSPADPPSEPSQRAARA